VKRAPRNKSFKKLLLLLLLLLPLLLLPLLLLLIQVVGLYEFIGKNIVYLRCSHCSEMPILFLREFRFMIVFALDRPKVFMNNFTERKQSMYYVGN
jgi:hypothetical protein